MTESKRESLAPWRVKDAADAGAVHFCHHRATTIVDVAEAFGLLLSYRRTVVELMSADTPEKLALARERYDAADMAFNEFWAR